MHLIDLVATMFGYILEGREERCLTLLMQSGWMKAAALLVVAAGLTAKMSVILEVLHRDISTKYAIL
jgi:hypothetical protein